MKIAERGKTATIYVNITGGTNLMAGADCSASFFIGAQAYKHIMFLIKKSFPKVHNSKIK